MSDGELMKTKSPKKVFVKVEGASDLAEIAKQLAEARWRYGSGAPVQVLPS